MCVCGQTCILHSHPLSLSLCVCMCVCYVRVRAPCECVRVCVLSHVPIPITCGPLATQRCESVVTATSRAAVGGMCTGASERRSYPYAQHLLNVMTHPPTGVTHDDECEGR